MSTRSWIGYVGDGMYYGVYCHYDGYVKEGVGDELLKDYNSFEKAKELVNKGDMRFPGQPYAEFEGNRTLPGNAGANKIIEPFRGFTLGQWLKKGFRSDAEYLYLFVKGQGWGVTTDGKKWQKIKDYKKDNDKRMNANELQEKLFEQVYKSRR